MNVLTQDHVDLDLAPLFGFIDLLRSAPWSEEEYDLIVGSNVRSYVRLRLLPFLTAHRPGDPMVLLKQRPVGFFQGALDTIVPCELVQQSFAKHFPDAPFHLFKHSGHSPFAEEPQHFNAELASFVRPLWHD